LFQQFAKSLQQHYDNVSTLLAFLKLIDSVIKTYAKHKMPTNELLGETDFIETLEQLQTHKCSTVYEVTVQIVE
jgi:hypothetical protein